MYNKNVRYESDYYLKSNNVVSIVLGVKSGHSIILATDSQASDRKAGTKRFNEIKIFDFKIDDTNIIYSGAENPHLNREIIDEIKNTYNPRSDFIKQCEEAYNKVKKRHPALVEKNNLPIRILIGVTNKIKGLELFHIQPNGLTINTREMVAIGCRVDWAENIFSDILECRNYEVVFKNNEEILKIMLYAVDWVKKYDLYCGGKSQYLILNRGGGIERTNEIIVKKLEGEISKINNEFRHKWWSKLGKEEQKK